MAKTAKAFTISKADLEKLPRSEQRRFIDLGLVEGVKAEPAKPAK